MNTVAANKIAESNLFAKFRTQGGLSVQVWQALGFRLTGLGLIFFVQVMLARLMGPAHFGDYTVIITTINLLIVFSMFGFDSSMLRFLPSFISKKEYASANGFVKFSYRIIIVFSIISSIGIFIFLITHSKKFNLSFREGLFWGLLLIPFLALIHQASAILRSLQKFKLSMLPVYFLFPIFMGISCLWYYNGHNKLTVDAAMLMNLLCTVVICIFIRKRSSKTLSLSVPSETITNDGFKWFSVSGVLFLTTALDLLLRQSDILMVSYFLGNTQAGYYSVAARLAMFTSLGLSVADYVFMPKISTFFESGKFDKLQQMIRNSSLQILSISLPVIFLLFLSGKWLLGFFGDPFTNSYLPLVILLGGQLINSLTGMVGGLMTMTGNQKTFFSFYLLAFLIQFFLNIFLIKWLGITGAAIGTSVSMIILNLMAYFFVKKKIKIKASFF